MSIRPHLAILTAILLGVAATVATSQTPQGSGEDSANLGGGPRWSTTQAAAVARAQPTSQVGAAGDMIGFSHVDGTGTQTITLVNTGNSWMAVYHIDRSGKIRLVSSRPIDADFSLQLNATSPLPEDIRRIGKPKG